MPSMQRMRRAAVAAAALLLVVAALATLASGTTVTPRAVEGPALGPRWERGMNATAYVPDGFAGTRAREALEGMAAAGTTHAVLVPVWYQPTAQAATIAPDPAKSPDDAGLREAARTARDLGMRVVVKPHVDVLDGTFRGEIAPADPDGWFAAYERMIVRYARLATAVGAETLVIGTELVGVAQQTDRFRRVIAAARAAFDGELTYAANWVQDAERIGFWDDLDLIGIDAYMPLTDPALGRPVNEDDLISAWRGWIDRLGALRARVGGDKPVVFTELGYPARSNATAAPSRQDTTAPVDGEAQALAYRAAFEAWRRVDWFRGIWWWDWSLDGRNAGRVDGSYRPAGTPAEQVLRAYAGTVPVADDDGTDGPVDPGADLPGD